MENNPGVFQHVYASLEDQIVGRQCLLHAGAETGGCCEASREVSPDLMISGSPCNPFSVQRGKRFQPGDVSAHASFSTTMKGVVRMYMRRRPKIGLIEQVMGFAMPFEKGGSETPLSRQGKFAKAVAIL